MNVIRKRWLKWRKRHWVTVRRRNGTIAGPMSKNTAEQFVRVFRGASIVPSKKKRRRE